MACCGSRWRPASAPRRSKWTRRAALRGLAGMAIASPAANVLAKRLVRRTRPERPLLPVGRVARPPRTTSFPSGHAASAAAFATGVALEVPALAVPVGGLAAAVGASRVVSRVHYPSDVLAGFALGTAAGLLTLRWWPRRPTAPAAAARPRREAPASPDGSGLVLSSTAARAPRPRSSPARSLPGCRRPRSSWPTRMMTWRACSARRRRERSILGVAGGDGTDPARRRGRRRRWAAAAGSAGRDLQSLRRRPRRRIRR